MTVDELLQSLDKRIMIPFVADAYLDRRRAEWTKYEDQAMGALRQAAARDAPVGVRLAPLPRSSRCAERAPSLRRRCQQRLSELDHVLGIVVGQPCRELQRRRSLEIDDDVD